MSEDTIIVGGEEFELVNAGTEYEFVKGCMSNRYKEACLREEGMTIVHMVEVRENKKV